MGPLEWLASRWTPEFEYQDRLADEVEDIAFESTRTGTRRGFLVGTLVGVVIALIGIGVLANRGVRMPFVFTPEPQGGRQVATDPLPSGEELALLKQENEQLKKQLAAARAEAASPRERRVVETKPPQPRVGAADPLPPRQKRVVERTPPQPKTAAPAPQPPKTVTKEVAATPEEKTSTPVGPAAQPIPSNCRKVGDCDSVGP